MNDVEIIMSLFYGIIVGGVLLLVRYFLGFEVAILLGVGFIVGAIVAKEK